MSKQLNRFIAFITACVFAVNQFLFPAESRASVPPANISEVNLATPGFQLTLPPDLGTVQSVVSGRGPAIVHIQDAHGQYEAQKNIRAMLKHLKDQYGIKLVLVEGSAFKLEPGVLKFFPDRMDLTREIADDLAKRALVKGAELHLLDEPGAGGYGIEELGSYRRNREAFQEVLLARRRTETFLRGMNLQIERLASALLNKNTRSFLGELDNFEAGKRPLQDWLALLKTEAREVLELDLSDPRSQFDWPMLVRIAKLKEFESKIDPSVLEREREQLFGLLAKTRPAEPSELWKVIPKIKMDDQDPKARFEGVKKTILATLDWMSQMDGFDHEAIASYRARAAENSQDYGAGPGVLLGKNGEGTILVNSRDLAPILTAIKTQKSANLFMEWALILEREASGAGALSATLSHLQNTYRFGERVEKIHQAQAKFAPDEDLGVPSEQMERLLNSFEGLQDETADLAAITISLEIQEILDERRTLKRLAAGGVYSNESAREEFKPTYGAIQDDGARAVYQGMRNHFDRIAATSNLEELVADQLAVSLRRIIAHDPDGNPTDLAYAYFMKSEFKRFQDTKGTEGLNPAMVSLVQNRQMVPCDWFRPAAKRLLSKVNEVITSLRGNESKEAEAILGSQDLTLNSKIASPTAMNNGLAMTGNEPRNDDLSMITRLLNSPLSQNQLPDPETGLLFERMLAYLPADFNYDAYPNLKYFVGHLILQSELKSDRLMKEMDGLADMIAERLARTDEEKKLLSILKNYRLLIKLFALELTPADYERALEQGESLRPGTITRQLFDLNDAKKVRDLTFDNLDAINALHEKALEFYRGAKERDQDMVKRIEECLKETGESKAVVITGGFHAGPFRDYFAGRGYNYALVAPKISSVSEQDHTSYVESILQSRSALQGTYLMMLPANRASQGEDLGWMAEQVSRSVARVLGRHSIRTMEGPNVQVRTIRGPDQKLAVQMNWAPGSLTLDQVQLLIHVVEQTLREVVEKEKVVWAPSNEPVLTRSVTADQTDIEAREQEVVIGGTKVVMGDLPQSSQILSGVSGAHGGSYNAQTAQSLPQSGRSGNRQLFHLPFFSSPFWVGGTTIPQQIVTLKGKMSQHEKQRQSRQKNQTQAGPQKGFSQSPKTSFQSRLDGSVPAWFYFPSMRLVEILNKVNNNLINNNTSTRAEVRTEPGTSAKQPFRVGNVPAMETRTEKKEAGPPAEGDEFSGLELISRDTVRLREQVIPVIGEIIVPLIREAAMPATRDEKEALLKQISTELDRLDDFQAETTNPKVLDEIVYELRRLSKDTARIRPQGDHLYQMLKDRLLPIYKLVQKLNAVDRSEARIAFNAGDVTKDGDGRDVFFDNDRFDNGQRVRDQLQSEEQLKPLDFQGPSDHFSLTHNPINRQLVPNKYTTILPGIENEVKKLLANTAPNVMEKILSIARWIKSFLASVKNSVLILMSGNLARNSLIINNYFIKNNINSAAVRSEARAGRWGRWALWGALAAGVAGTGRAAQPPAAIQQAADEAREFAKLTFDATMTETELKWANSAFDLADRFVPGLADILADKNVELNIGRSEDMQEGINSFTVIKMDGATIKIGILFRSDILSNRYEMISKMFVRAAEAVSYHERARTGALLSLDHQAKIDAIKKQLKALQTLIADDIMQQLAPKTVEAMKGYIEKEEQELAKWQAMPKGAGPAIAPRLEKKEDRFPAEYVIVGGILLAGAAAYVIKRYLNKKYRTRSEVRNLKRTPSETNRGVPPPLILNPRQFLSRAEARAGLDASPAKAILAARKKEKADRMRELIENGTVDRSEVRISDEKIAAFERELGISKDDLAHAIVKHPQLAGLDPARVRDGYKNELGISKDDLAHAIVKFPQLAGLDPARNIKPKLQLIRSLGVPRQEELTELMRIVTMSALLVTLIAQTASEQGYMLKGIKDVARIYRALNRIIKLETNKTAPALIKQDPAALTTIIKPTLTQIIQRRSEARAGLDASPEQIAFGVAVGAAAAVGALSVWHVLARSIPAQLALRRLERIHQRAIMKKPGLLREWFGWDLYWLVRIGKQYEYDYDWVQKHVMGPEHPVYQKAFEVFQAYLDVIKENPTYFIGSKRLKEIGKIDVDHPFNSKGTITNFLGELERSPKTPEWMMGQIKGIIAVREKEKERRMRELIEGEMTQRSEVRVGRSGRPRLLTDEQVKQAYERLKAKKKGFAPTREELASRLDVSVATLYPYLERLASKGTDLKLGYQRSFKDERLVEAFDRLKLKNNGVAPTEIELAVELSVSESTVHKNLKRLAKAGIKLKTSNSKKRRDELYLNSVVEAHNRFKERYKDLAPSIKDLAGELKTKNINRLYRAVKRLEKRGTKLEISPRRAFTLEQFFQTYNRLTSEDSTPTAKELAKELRVDISTMQRFLKGLVEKGVLSPRRRRAFTDQKLIQTYSDLKNQKKRKEIIGRDLASVLGVDTSTVYRSLRALKKQGIDLGTRGKGLLPTIDPDELLQVYHRLDHPSARQLADELGASRSATYRALARTRPLIWPQDELFQKYLPLMERVSRFYARASYENVPDPLAFLGAAAIGFQETLRRYAPNHPHFEQLAEQRMRQRVLDQIREESSRSRTVVSGLKRIGAAGERLWHEGITNPSISELAQSSQLPESKVHDLLAHQHLPISLSLPLDGQESEHDLLDVLPEKEPNEAFQEALDLIERYGGELEFNERYILEQYYLNPKRPTMKTIASELNISESRASQLHGSAIQKLKDRYHSENQTGRSEARSPISRRTFLEMGVTAGAAMALKPFANAVSAQEAAVSEVVQEKLSPQLEGFRKSRIRTFSEYLKLGRGLVRAPIMVKGVRHDPLILLDQTGDVHYTQPLVLGMWAHLLAIRGSYSQLRELHYFLAAMQDKFKAPVWVKPGPQLDRSKVGFEDLVGYDGNLIAAIDQLLVQFRSSKSPVQRKQIETLIQDYWKLISANDPIYEKLYDPDKGMFWGDFSVGDNGAVMPIKDRHADRIKMNETRAAAAIRIALLVAKGKVPDAVWTRVPFYIGSYTDRNGQTYSVVNAYDGAAFINYSNMYQLERRYPDLAALNEHNGLMHIDQSVRSNLEIHFPTPVYIGDDYKSKIGLPEAAEDKTVNPKVAVPAIADAFGTASVLAYVLETNPKFKDMADPAMGGLPFESKAGGQVTKRHTAVIMMPSLIVLETMGKSTGLEPFIGASKLHGVKNLGTLVDRFYSEPALNMQTLAGQKVDKIIPARSEARTARQTKALLKRLIREQAGAEAVEEGVPFMMALLKDFDVASDLALREGHATNPIFSKSSQDLLNQIKAHPESLRILLSGLKGGLYTHIEGAPYIFKLLIYSAAREPDEIEPLFTEEGRVVRPVEELRRDLEARLERINQEPGADIEEKRKKKIEAVNRFLAAEFLKIFLNYELYQLSPKLDEMLNAGPSEEVIALNQKLSAALTGLSKLILQAVLGVNTEYLDSLHGAPAAKAVILLGGSHARNEWPSFDYDAIFIYDTDGTTPGGTKAAASHKDYYTRLARLISGDLALMGRQYDVGFQNMVFSDYVRNRRMDREAPWAISLAEAQVSIKKAAARNEVSERAVALLLMTYGAGDRELADQFAQFRGEITKNQSFVEKALAEHYEIMNAQPETHREGTIEIKDDRGGLRSIHFVIWFALLYQRLLALTGGGFQDGQAPDLSDPNTFSMLDQLLTPDVAKTFKAYFIYLINLRFGLDLFYARNNKELPSYPDTLKHFAHYNYVAYPGAAPEYYGQEVADLFLGELKRAMRSVDQLSRQAVSEMLHRNAVVNEAELLKIADRARAAEAEKTAQEEEKKRKEWQDLVNLVERYLRFLGKPESYAEKAIREGWSIVADALKWDGVGRSEARNDEALIQIAAALNALHFDIEPKDLRTAYNTVASKFENKNKRRYRSDGKLRELSLGYRTIADRIETMEQDQYYDGLYGFTLQHPEVTVPVNDGPRLLYLRDKLGIDGAFAEEKVWKNEIGGRHFAEISAITYLIVPAQYEALAEFYILLGQNAMESLLKKSKPSSPIPIEEQMAAISVSEPPDATFRAIYDAAIRISPNLDFKLLYETYEAKKPAFQRGLAGRVAIDRPQGRMVKIQWMSYTRRLDDSADNDNWTAQFGPSGTRQVADHPLLRTFRDQFGIEDAYLEEESSTSSESSRHFDWGNYEFFLLVPPEFGVFARFYVLTRDVLIKRILFGEGADIGEEVRRGIRILGKHPDQAAALGNKEAGFLVFEKLGLPYPPGIVLSEQLVQSILDAKPDRKRDYIAFIIAELERLGFNTHYDNVGDNPFANDEKVYIRSNPKVSMPGILTTQSGALFLLEYLLTEVAKAWDSDKAKAYRKRSGIPDDYDLPIIIQKTVNTSLPYYSHSQYQAERRRVQNPPPIYAAGVFSTRDPNTGEDKFFGRYIENARGDQLMTGGESGEDINGLREIEPAIYSQLLEAKQKLESEYGPYEVEFAIEEGRLFFVQGRRINFSPQAEIAYLNEQMALGKIAPPRAIPRLEALQRRLGSRSIFKVRPGVSPKSIGSGLASTPGAVAGYLAWDKAQAERLKTENKPVIFVADLRNRNDAMSFIFDSPDSGLITTYGNNSSHEAVLTRLAGIPSLIHFQGELATKWGRKLRPGERVVLDGDRNALYKTNKDILVPSGAVLDASFGINIQAFKESFLKPYLSPDGKVSGALSKEELERLNAAAQAKYDGLKDGPDKKAAFIANLEKHFLHDLLVQKTSDRSEVRNEEDIQHVYGKIEELVSAFRAERIQEFEIALPHMLEPGTTYSPDFAHTLVEEAVLGFTFTHLADYLERIDRDSERNLVLMANFAFQFCDVGRHVFRVLSEHIMMQIIQNQDLSIEELRDSIDYGLIRAQIGEELGEKANYEFVENIIDIFLRGQSELIDLFEEPHLGPAVYGLVMASQYSFYVQMRNFFTQVVTSKAGFERYHGPLILALERYQQTHYPFRSEAREEGRFSQEARVTFEGPRHRVLALRWEPFMEEAWKLLTGKPAYADMVVPVHILSGEDLKAFGAEAALMTHAADQARQVIDLRQLPESPEAWDELIVRTLYDRKLKVTLLVVAPEEEARQFMKKIRDYVQQRYQVPLGENFEVLAIASMDDVSSAVNRIFDRLGGIATAFIGDPRAMKKLGARAGLLRVDRSEARELPADPIYWNALTVAVGELLLRDLPPELFTAVRKPSDLGLAKQLAELVTSFRARLRLLVAA